MWNSVAAGFHFPLFNQTEVEFGGDEPVVIRDYLKPNNPKNKKGRCTDIWH